MKNNTFFGFLTPLFFTISLIFLLSSPRAIGAIIDDIKPIPVNNTLPRDSNNTIIPVEKYIEYRYEILEEKYLDIKTKKMDSESFNQDILYNNQITYYYYNGRYYPYPLLRMFSSLSHNPDYGENETYLGQVIDSYFNDDYINATLNVSHNATAYCVDIDVSTQGAEENYTDYTEVDVPADRIIFYDNNMSVEHDSYRSEVTYAYYNYGAKTFYEYEVSFNVYVDNEDEFASGAPFFISNNTGHEKAHINNVWGYSLMRFYRSTPPAERQLMIRAFNSTGTYQDTKYLYPFQQWLYVTMGQNATHLYADVYTDEAKTVLWHHYEVAFEPEYYSHHYACNGFKTVTAGNSIQYNVTDRIVFEETVYYDVGNYTTNEFLDGDRGLVLMYNVSIPSGAYVRVEFSNDSSNWVNHNGVAGYDSLEDGFGALDIRDLNENSMYNRVTLSSNNNISSAVYQLRYITILGTAIEDNTGALFIVGFILSMIIFIGVGSKLG